MVDNKDIEREKIVREFEKTAESIRRKRCALKIGKIEEDITTKSNFKPTIELQKIVDNSSMRAIKDEPHDDDDVKTLSVQKREDAKWSKRKRSNTSLDRKSKRLDAPRLDASSITSTPSATTVQPIMLKSLANKNIFETTGDLLAESIQNQLQTLEGQKTLRETF